MSNSEWVIGKYSGEQAKNIKALSDAGVGYFVRQESGSGGGYTIEVGFRRVISDEPRPLHLEAATPAQAEKLEKMRTDRTGIPKEYRSKLYN